MRKLFAWLGAAMLFVSMSRAEAANDVLKPYVVMILDTSGSMGAATGSGPTSCGKRDTRINHAVCAINNIVNSYGEMVFALGRFREVTNGAGTAGSQVCDANGDQEGNVGRTLPNPSGGDICNTQGPYCGDCDPSTGSAKACTLNSQCTNNSCVSGFCNVAGTNFGCKNGAFGGANYNDSAFEVLTPLVDGNNNEAAEYTDGTCNACSVATSAGAINPEIWGVSQSTFTPLSASLQGAMRYWQGQALSLDGTNTTIWPAANGAANNPGFDPINRDPSAAVFLSANGAASCNANPNSCVQFIGETAGAQCADSLDNDGDLRINDGCAAVGPPETNCADTVDDDSDGFVNDGCPAWCNGTSCCCASQCRPYITILLTDGDETCTTTGNTVLATQDLKNTTPRSDAIVVTSINRTGGVVTVNTTSPLPHPFNVGDQIFVGGTGVGAYLTPPGGFPVATAPSGTQLTYLQAGVDLATVTNGASSLSFLNIRHTASFNNYTILTKPIGFGVAPGNTAIEDIAHAGGAFDVPGVNEGYYAQDEADLELAISKILADSVRAETCNGRDDDCDTRIDEDFPTKGNTCTNGQVGQCVRSGTLVCSTTGGLVCNAVAGVPQQEICNNIDDDCDGFIDETIERGAECANNTNDDVIDAVFNDGCPAVGPAETNCADNVDNDSDGFINDGCPGVGTCNTCVPIPEICDGADNDCDGVADQTCRCSGGTTPGATCNPTGTACPGSGSTCLCTLITRPCGVGTCAGTETCTGNNIYTGCTAQVPTAEQCDGADNDCDGLCDGITLDCSQQNGVCNNNATSCPGTDSFGSPTHWPSPDTAEVACNNAVDDDKDGFINDGCPAVNAAETGANCANATDDDSDGAINDGCPVPALPIAQNVCRPGSRGCPLSATCTPGAVFSSCLNEVQPCVGPSCDGCNALDDDCDNKIDEDFVGADCSTNCGIGTTVCQNGNIVCNSAAATGDATCNNIDDDCDGKFDEDWVCDPAVNCVGVDCCKCGTGTTCEVNKCINGARTCVVDPAINTETCNCTDDDCDGSIDEDPAPGTPICVGGGTCVPGTCQCAFGCALGEFPCPLGKKCENTQAGDFCVNDPCFNVTCNPVNGNVQTCIQKPGSPTESQCVDTCSLVNDNNNTTFPACPPTQVCVGSLGECRPNNCTTFPDMCTGAQSCVNGTCVSNPCQGVTCDTSKYCLGGECIASCADVTCQSGQRCRAGACESDPCGHVCPFGQACNDSTGQCIEDPCKFRDCPSGQWCNPNDGQCEDDPCVTSHITCPAAGEVCRGGTCVDPTDDITIDGGGVHVTVGGGGCNTSGGNGGFLLALGLMGLLLSRRRRTAGGAL